MNSIFISFSSLFLVMSLLVSCSNTKSDNVKTSGFYATLSVDGNNQNSVTCKATFQVGGATGTYLDLNAGDSVTCNGNSMNRSELLGAITYSATVTYQPESTYSIVLNRSGEGSYTSTVKLPAAITNLSPNSAFSTSKGSVMNISWTPSSNATEDTFEAYLSGSGISAILTDTPPEQGALGFGSADTTPSPSSSNTGSISASLQYSRIRNGTLANSLSGTIKAYQRSTISVTLN